MSELGPTLTSSDRTATDELRRLLDERGVKHEGERSVRWRDRNGVIMQAFPLASGELGLEVWSCTPEQAIAATLGDTDATGGRQSDADLVAENAKLRELLEAVLQCAGETKRDKGCDACPMYNGPWRNDGTWCLLRPTLRELGVEVEP